jgi:predicted nucleic acid-binding protein
MKFALDTNVLAYAESVGDDAVRRDASLALVAGLPRDGVIPAQVLGELFRVLTKKAKRDAAMAREAVLGWADAYPVAESSWSAFQSALDLGVDHGLPVWDALILSVAAESGCRLLLSEDFQHGFTWRGITVVNPYLATPHPLLAAALSR